MLSGISAEARLGIGAVCPSGTGVPPVNRAQDARATFKLHQQPRIFYLDTDLLFPETYVLRDRLEARYGVRFERRTPRLSLADQAAEYGERLWERQPDLCCRLRKVEPLREMLDGVRAWVTAIRREQSPQRANRLRQSDEVVSQMSLSDKFVGVEAFSYGHGSAFTFRSCASWLRFVFLSREKRQPRNTPTDTNAV
jgi:hypothetical protein